ncbi:MAG: hypothetical protein ACHQUC_00955 [Chlamydiales bacterium]
MNSEKQLLANQQNAQLSTGPKTVCGKAIVSTNAIRHGIFTKDLILSSDIENEDEYREILNNLMECLSPCNQIESLLIEKIAVDFWRLRRTIRFETGSIVKCIKSLLEEIHTYGDSNNEKIDEEIQHKKQLITWNTSYFEYLVNGVVTFDQPIWEQNDFSSDIIEDFYTIARVLPLTKTEREKLYNGMEFDKLRILLNKYGYFNANEISAKLIELYMGQNQCLEDEIQKLTQQKLANDASDKLTFMLGMTPQTDNAEKIMKYERSLQKSIFQNLCMLKKLQGAF